MVHTVQDLIGVPNVGRIRLRYIHMYISNGAGVAIFQNFFYFFSSAYMRLWALTVFRDTLPIPKVCHLIFTPKFHLYSASLLEAFSNISFFCDSISRIVLSHSYLLYGVWYWYRLIDTVSDGTQNNGLWLHCAEDFLDHVVPHFFFFFSVYFNVSSLMVLSLSGICQIVCVSCRNS